MFFISASADVLSPVLGFSFYRDAQGVWIDHNYLKPFTIAYALYMLLLFVLLVTYNKRIPGKLLYVLFITKFVCVFLVFLENHYGHNSFLATTFLLPIFVILFMVHANSYSLKTGMVFPDHFIPLAEKYGYIHKLSMIILNKTCQAVSTLQQEGYLLPRVSVNLSISELSKPDFMEEFTSIVQSNHLPFETIAVELTESRNDTEYEIVLDRVNQFKNLGVCTYLDDFGFWNGIF